MTGLFKRLPGIEPPGMKQFGTKWLNERNEKYHKQHDLSIAFQISMTYAVTLCEQLQYQPISTETNRLIDWFRQQIPVKRRNKRNGKNARND